MKIRFLLMNAYAPGGTVTTTFAMAGALAAKKHDVEIISVYRRRRSDPLKSPPAGVPIRVLLDLREDRPVQAPSGRADRAKDRVRTWLEEQPSRLVPREEIRYPNFSLRTDLALMRFLRSFDEGVLVSTRPALNIITARFGRRSAVKVGQEHMYLLKHEAEIIDHITKSYGRLDAVAALTQRDADDFVRALGPGVRVVAIPNAVPPRQGVRASLQEKVVLAAGRNSYQKGWNFLIAAFAVLAREHPDWVLRMFTVGSEENMQALLQRISEHGLDGRVEVKGYTQSLEKEMGRASIYALSSRYEGFPMVLLEAMAAGLPPVAFDCPNGPAELIDDGRNGIVVPLGDAEALGRGFVALADDEELRRSMGAAAVETAAGYDLATTADRWEQLFDELLAEKAGTKRRSWGPRTRGGRIGQIAPTAEQQRLAQAKAQAKARKKAQAAAAAGAAAPAAAAAQPAPLSRPDQPGPAPRRGV